MRRRATRAVPASPALTYRAAALLLDYPTTDLVGLLPTVRAALGATGSEAGSGAGAGLGRLVDHLATTPLIEAQAEYVETFDTRRRCALHLTYYAHGETRRRGEALVRVQRVYRAAGFEVSDELPDHVCVILEFAARCDPEAGLALLLEHRAGLETLRLALLDQGSPWADALVAVCATLPPLAGEERAAVAALVSQGPPEEQVGLDPYSAMPPGPSGPVPVPLTTRPREGVLR